MQGKAQLSDSNRRIMEVDAPPRRVYQAWKGSNLFLLGGRLIFGPDVRSLVLTVCLIVTPVIFFAAAVCPQLGHEFHNQIGGWVASVAVIFTVYPSFRKNNILHCFYHVKFLLFYFSHLGVILESFLEMLIRQSLKTSVNRPTYQIGQVVNMVRQTTYENFRYRYDRKTNPYNLGVVQNFMDILFSRVPSSKNNFRAKVMEDSAAFTSSLSMGRVLSPAKMSVDLEMGMKRQAVAAEDLEDLHSQIGSAMGLERCGTEPPHFVGRKGCSEISSDIEAFAEEFGMERGFSERKKIERRTNDGS
nr:unnamed protein product [Digitaria exilis]